MIGRALLLAALAACACSTHAQTAAARAIQEAAGGGARRQGNPLEPSGFPPNRPR